MPKNKAALSRIDVQTQLHVLSVHKHKRQRVSLQANAEAPTIILRIRLIFLRSVYSPPGLHCVQSSAFVHSFSSSSFSSSVSLTTSSSPVGISDLSTTVFASAFMGRKREIYANFLRKTENIGEGRATKRIAVGIVVFRRDDVISMSKFLRPGEKAPTLVAVQTGSATNENASKMNRGTGERKAEERKQVRCGERNREEKQGQKRGKGEEKERKGERKRGERGRGERGRGGGEWKKEEGTAKRELRERRRRRGR